MLKIPTLNFGHMIFLSRKNNNLTQEELAGGICSIPYLSKLENNKIDPSNEILIPLLKKLNLDLETVTQNHVSLYQLIYKGFNAIVSYNQDQSNTLKKEIDKYESYFLPSDLYYLIKIYKIRYNISISKINDAELIFSDLYKYEDKMISQTKRYFFYIKGLMHYHKSHFHQAIKLLSIAEESFKAEDNEQLKSDIYFFLSLTNNQLYNTSLAIYYANIAVSSFSQELQFERLMECQIIISVNLIRLGYLTEASTQLEAVKEKSKANEFNKIIAYSLHTSAYLESKKKNHILAIDLLQEALSYIGKEDNFYFELLLTLSVECINLRKIENANKFLSNVLKNYLDSSQYLKAKVYQLLLNDHTEELLVFLEKEVIPYFETKQDIVVLHEMFNIAANVFEKNRKYKKSSVYFKKCLELNVGKLDLLEVNC